MLIRKRTVEDVIVASEINPAMADAVDRRRLQLGMTPGDFATAAGLTRQGLDPVRKGELRKYNDRTILGVARALRWEPDWYERLSSGRSPIEAQPHPGDESWDDLRSSLSPEDQASVRAIIESLRSKGHP